MDKISDNLSGLMDKIFGLPDKPSNPQAKKVAAVAFGVGIIVLSLIVFQFTLNSMGIDSLGNPNPMKIMGFMLPMAGGAFGFAILLHSFVPRKYHRATSKVLAFATVFFFIGAGLSLMAFAYYNTPTGPMVSMILENPWLMTGALLTSAGGVFSLGRALGFLGDVQGAVTVESPEYLDMLEMRQWNEYKRQQELDAERAKALLAMQNN